METIVYNWSVISRFWTKVQIGRSDECWPWLAGTFGKQYGCFSIHGKMHRSNRTAWQIANNMRIPEGLHVLHSCDNPGCCNPMHLRLGTHQDNMNDRQARGRTVRGERSGKVKLTKSQVTSIRAWSAAGHSQSTIAAAFGISKAQVGVIVTRKQWTHV
jgi:hypothetical protein